MNIFCRLTIIFCFLILSDTNSFAQMGPIEGYVQRATVYRGDTIPYIELPEFRYIAPREFSSRAEQVRYTRLVRNVKKVYPYARLAGIKFDEYSLMLMSIESDHERKKMTKEIEEEIRDQFEGELRKLTISQGHILIKLIDRETSHSSYDVLKDFRGSFSAVFWQSLGRLFGYNLRTKYDPEGEDKMIEEIVQLIEMGAI